MILRTKLRRVFPFARHFDRCHRKRRPLCWIWLLAATVIASGEQTPAAEVLAERIGADEIVRLTAGEILAMDYFAGRLFLAVDDTASDTTTLMVYEEDAHRAFRPKFGLRVPGKVSRIGALWDKRHVLLGVRVSVGGLAGPIVHHGAVRQAMLLRADLVAKTMTLESARAVAFELSPDRRRIAFIGIGIGNEWAGKYPFNLGRLWWPVQLIVGSNGPIRDDPWSTVAVPLGYEDLLFSVCWSSSGARLLLGLANSGPVFTRQRLAQFLGESTSGGSILRAKDAKNRQAQLHRANAYSALRAVELTEDGFVTTDLLRETVATADETVWAAYWPWGFDDEKQRAYFYGLSVTINGRDVHGHFRLTIGEAMPVLLFKPDDAKPDTISGVGQSCDPSPSLQRVAYAKWTDDYTDPDNPVRTYDSGLVLDLKTGNSVELNIPAVESNRLQWLGHLSTWVSDGAFLFAGQRVVYRFNVSQSN